MRIGRPSLFALFFSVACLPISNQAQSRTDAPHLERHGDAAQLFVDGKPYLILSGELTNNAATALEPMETIWPKLVASNLNTVLVGVSWAQFEPEDFGAKEE